MTAELAAALVALLTSPWLILGAVEAMHVVAGRE